ncbi:MAG: DUF4924 family protein [Muribaculaceae bacterium]
MIIANQKKKENIAEYLLYMWQIEDIIRAYNLDIDLIYNEVVSKYNVSDEIKVEIKEWYDSLIQMMRLENIVNNGHLQINKNTLIRLNDIHVQLLKSPKFSEYGAEFYKTLPYIVELRAKAGENKADELETCFNALYGMLMLKFQGKEITIDTQMAIKQISRFIATLADFYKKNEESPLFEENKEDND